MDAIKLDARELAKHRPHLVKFAMLQLRNHAQAEDAVQETLLAALQAADRFAGGSSVRTWLIGILKHKIVDHLRRQSREVSLAAQGEEGALEALDGLFEGDGHFREDPADWGDPETALARQEFFDLLQQGLERLPKNTARAFTLREVMGLSTEEICETLGITEANCWVMLHRARLSLRKHLEERWFAPAARGRAGAPAAAATS
jgi:RNA polymerase sigma-70 factor (ECF subfamily)